MLTTKEYSGPQALLTVVDLGDRVQLHDLVDPAGMRHDAVLLSLVNHHVLHVQLITPGAAGLGGRGASHCCEDVLDDIVEDVQSLMERKN